MDPQKAFKPIVKTNCAKTGAPRKQTLPFHKQRGWSGGAKVLGTTNLDNSRARGYCACNRCGWRLFGHFFLSSIFSLVYLFWIGMLKLGRMHRQTGETFVDPTAVSRQMRDVSDF